MVFVAVSKSKLTPSCTYVSVTYYNTFKMDNKRTTRKTRPVKRTKPKPSAKTTGAKTKTKPASADREYYSQTMYQKGAKGETRVWRIWVTGKPGSSEDGGEGIIHREHGTLGGKQTGTTRVISEGKNLGKKNETTPLDQAIAEAKSVVTKKTREGYSPEESSRGKTSGDVILPMLAHDYHKQKKPLTFPCYAQPKLDGVRMLVEVTPDGLRMTTRTGKEIGSMDHIRTALEPLLFEIGVVLDGELFTFDKTFEEITGIVRRSIRDEHTASEARGIDFHVFDAFIKGQEHVPFTERHHELLNEHIREVLPPDDAITFVETVEIHSQEGADAIHERFTDEGYEGTMYRQPDGKYKIRLRSRDLLKRKDFQTEEYEIVGATQGLGKDAGTVIWTVKTPVCSTGAGDMPVAPQTFSVRPRGSMTKRREWWEHRDEYIGKMLTVRFQNLTEGGIPRFPVGLTIRDYE